MMKSLLLIFSLMLVAPVWAMEIVATTASMGMLARTVAGPEARVTELAPPDRDAHMLQAKPSMLRALRDAQLVVAVGAELEIAWLPAAIQGSANAAIQPGRQGYLEAAAQVSRLDVGASADRSQGDVHPGGNPHVNLDPLRMASIAKALANRMAVLDPGRGDAYRQRAEGFAAEIGQRTPQWRQRVAGKAGALTYHKDAIYLLDFLGLPFLGTLEPVPGVSPTASHLEALAARLKGGGGVIVHTPYQPAAGASKLAQWTGMRVATLPIEPPAQSDARAYFDLIDRWVDVLAK